MLASEVPRSIRRRSRSDWLIEGITGLLGASYNAQCAYEARGAVGTPVTRRPPHRSRRAALPHRAPALGDDAQVQSACRTQSCACGRVARPCVRPLWCLTRFPLASPLLSTPSASSSALEPLFEGFVDTMGLSDSLHACIPGVSPMGSPCGPDTNSPGQVQGLPGSAQRVSVHARG